MATHNPQMIDGVAGGTISKGQFVKYASGGWVACSSAGELSDGIAFNDAVSGGAVAVQIGGKCIFLVGGVDLADGAITATSASGAGIVTTTGYSPRLKCIGIGKAGAYAEGIWLDGTAVS